MIQIAPQFRLLVANEAIDGRKGIDAIAQLCQEKLHADPFSGDLFIFRTRRWPETSGEVTKVVLSHEELAHDAVATRIVKLIDELFGIDALAREDKLDHAVRHLLRLERAQPLVETIRGEVEAARNASLPSSTLGKAANHTLLQWRKLTRFLGHAELELSNSLAENSMCPVALGRKNWIHVGSQQAGPKVAAILSIVETCRRIKIPIRGYLAAVLPGIADVSIHRLADLTPAAWATRQQ